jgi:hypothetical protein
MNTQNYTITIPAGRNDVITKTVGRINRRRAKGGDLNALTITTSDIYTVSGLSWGLPRDVAVVDVTISGLVWQTHEWTVLAKVEHAGDTAVIKSIPAIGIIANAARNAGVEMGVNDAESAMVAMDHMIETGHEFTGAMARAQMMLLAGVDWNKVRSTAFCDHCQTKRRRHTTFVLHNGDTSLQVGSTCLTDFVDDGGMLETTFKDIARIGKAVGEMRYVGNDYPHVVERDDFMAHVCAAARVYGWVSGKAAYERNLIPTASRAMVSYWGQDPLMVTDDDRAHAERMVAAVGEIPAGGNDFEANLIASLKDVYLQDRHTRIAAAAWIWYQKRQDDARKRNGSKPAGEHVGIVGQYATGEVTLEKIIDFGENGYGGFTRLFVFRTQAGDKMSWKTSSYPEMTKGECYTIRAKVKQHREFRGEPDTWVTHVKVV